MVELALYQPEIPPNTGNIIRLCANSGAKLHLIHPLGFALDDKRLRRAGLDYAELTLVQQHVDFAAFLGSIAPRRPLALSTKGQTRYCEHDFQADDVLLFGPETRGLPDQWLAQLPSTQSLRLPMQSGSRSLNLSNAAAIVLYEAWRQLDFVGASH